MRQKPARDSLAFRIASFGLESKRTRRAGTDGIGFMGEKAPTPNAKCECEHCGERIEYPWYAGGMMIACPHCGKQTELGAESRGKQSAAASADESGSEIGSPPSESGAKRNGSARRAIVIGTIAAIAAGLAGRIYYLNKHGATHSPDISSPTNTATATGTPSGSNAVSELSTNTPKSIADLKVTPIIMQKTPGSGLVYAIGKVRNASAHQRYGVRIELDLLDRSGMKVGSASDYIAVIEPQQTWSFRALVNDPAAVKAKLADVKEQE